MEKLIENAKDGKITIVNLTGEAERFLEPVAPIVKTPLSVIGNLSTVFEFLKKRSHKYVADNCRLKVNLQELSIVFVGNEQQENNDFPTVIKGQVQLSPEIKSFPLEQCFDPVELAKNLRKWKSYFLDKAEFTTIFSQYSAFKAEVNRQIEIADDRSGNASNTIKQQVSHNLHQSFVLKIPIVKGEKAQPITIEIDIDPIDLSCTMFYFGLDVLLQNKATALIDAELEKTIKDVKMRDLYFTYYE